MGAIKFHFFFHINKGFKILSKNKDVHSLRLAKYKLLITNLNLNNFDKNIFKYYSNDIDNEKIIKQYINQKIVSFYIDDLYYYFISTKKKFIYPLPLKMLKEIENERVKINKFLSFFSWIFLCIIFIFYNFFSLIKFWFKLIKILLFQKKKNESSESIIFCNVNAKKILLSNPELGEYNLLNWAKKNIGDYKYYFLDQNSKSLFKKKNYDLINDHYNLILPYLNKKKYFFKSINLFFSIIKNIVFFRWWNLFLLKEAAISNLYECADKGFSKKYIFLYSGNIFRPLWTYSAEKKGSQIELLPRGIFNEMKLKYPKSFDPDWQGFCIMTWPKFYCWNICSKKFLIEVTTNKPEIKLLNFHTYFKDLKINLDIPSKSISVFSYEEHRLHHGMSTMGDYQNENLNLIANFYNDILELLNKNNITMIIKRKKIDKNDTKKNKFLFNLLKEKNNVVFCNPDVSVESLSQQTLGTISLPFSSAAHVSTNYNKPTVFYDPTKWVNVDDPAACGIRLINSKAELSKWIANINI